MPRIRVPDFETFPITEEDQSPQPVCLSVGHTDGLSLIYPTQEMGDALEELLDSGDVLAGVNFPFDLEVWCKYWPEHVPKLIKAAEELRIVDLAVWDRCAQIEGRTRMKRPSMVGLAQAYRIDSVPDKESDVRVTYAQYLNRPLSDYSEEHLFYMVQDGVTGGRIAAVLNDRYGDLLQPAALQTIAHWWRKNCSNTGMYTDRDAVKRLRSVAEKRVAELLEFAQELFPLPGEKIPEGLAGRKLDEYRLVRLNGVKNKKRLQKWVELAYDNEPPITRKTKTASPNWKPQIATGKEVLENSGHPVLELFADYGEWSAILNKDLQEKMLGAKIIHTRFWIANSTRSTSANPNTQNFRRAPGIRECIVPPPGHAILAADHGGMELATAAEAAIEYCGSWDLANKLLAGIDMHSYIGCEMSPWSYEELNALRKLGHEEAIKFRGFGKVPVFGTMGGMSLPSTLSLFGRRQGIPITEEQAAEALEICFQKNPDIVKLKNYIKWECPQNGKLRHVPIPGTGLTRRNATQPAAANTLFQGRGAAVEAHTGWQLWKAMHDSNNPLSTSRMCNFVHDEFLFYTPIEDVSPAARELERIMHEAPKVVCPNIPLYGEAVAMTVWSKKAESHWDGDELTIWSPEK